MERMFRRCVHWNHDKRTSIILFQQDIVPVRNSKTYQNRRKSFSGTARYPVVQTMLRQ